MEIKYETKIIPEKIMAEKIIPEKTEKLTIYVAKDGKQFDKKHHCVNYEFEYDYSHLTKISPVPINVQLISLDTEQFADIIYIKDKKDIEIISNFISIYDDCQTFNFKIPDYFESGFYVLVYKITQNNDDEEMSNFNLIPITEYLKRINGIAYWYNETFK